MTLFFILVIVIIIVVLLFVKSKPIPSNKVGLHNSPTNFQYTVYKAEKHFPKNIITVLEGNKIDELGYQIYKSYTADLDKIDILIRDNQTGEVMKIVKDGDSESMIGVSHPSKGHIGYLQFEIIENY